MEFFKIKPLGEGELEAAIEAVGGRRAHPDVSKRSALSADFLLGEAIIELKILDEDWFNKPEQQLKLAALFREYWPDRPVIVLNPNTLPEEGKRKFRSLARTPIKSGIAHAKKQLRQSRIEHPDLTCSVLFLINNNSMGFSHDELLALADERIRNDTTQIDVLVVAGSYYHSDGFELYCHWPIDAVTVHPESPFLSYDLLSKAWGELANRYMSEMIQEPEGSKGPIEDTVFEIDGVTFVRPAAPIGGHSLFFPNGRPRRNSTGLKVCPPVATVFPGLDLEQWKRVRSFLVDPDELFNSYEAWLAYQSCAASTDNPLMPFVVMAVSRDSFELWCTQSRKTPTSAALMEYATAEFHKSVHQVIASAAEYVPNSELPNLSIFVTTEIIGQDRANDVSHLRIIDTQKRKQQPLALNVRIFHEHAVALAGAYAIARNVKSVLWIKDMTHAWY